MRVVPPCPVRVSPSPVLRSRSGSTPRPEVSGQPTVEGQFRIADHGCGVPDEAARHYEEPLADAKRDHPRTDERGRAAAR
jgi:hypothetical protein